jgi:hypothetical protein
MEIIPLPAIYSLEAMRAHTFIHNIAFTHVFPKSKGLLRLFWSLDFCLFYSNIYIYN